MPMPRSLDPTATDSPNRVVRVFTFSKTGQLKLLPSSRRSPQSDGCFYRMGESMSGYALKVYIKRTEESV